MAHFIEDYLDYAAPSTDAPRVYHEFAAFSTLSALVGRNVWSQHGHYRIYPNLWVVLLGSSTTARKSTSLRISQDLVRAVDNRRILPDDFSVEAFMEVLGHQPEAILYFDEFLSLSSKFGRDYMAGLKSLLTELYECKDHVKRTLRRKGKQLESVPGSGQSGKVEDCVINNSFLSIFSASTVHWFTERLQEGDFIGGLIPRFCLVPAEQEEIQPEMIEPPPRDEAQRQALIDRLSQLAYIKGPMALLDADHNRRCHEDFSKVYTPWGEDADPLFGPYFERLKTYARKYAMLYEVGRPEILDTAMDRSSEPRAIPLTRDSVDWGWQVCHDLARRANNLRGRISFGDYERAVQKIESALRGKEQVTKSEILRKIRMPVFELDRALETMIQAGTVRTWKEERKDVERSASEPPMGRPTVYYKEVTHFIHRKELDDVGKM